MAWTSWTSSLTARSFPRASAQNERVRHVAACVDPHALLLQVLADRAEPALAPDARALVAAERRHVAHRPVGVDPHGAGLEALGHGERPFDALGPDAGREAVDGAVGDLESLLVVVERHDREDWAEHLLVGDPHLWRDLGEDRGLDEPPLAAFRAARRPAAEGADRTLALGDVDVLQHLLVLRPGGDRPDLGGVVEGIAHPRRAREIEQTLGELVVNLAVDERARARDAGLAGRGEDPRDHALHGIV